MSEIFRDPILQMIKISTDYILRFCLATPFKVATHIFEAAAAAADKITFIFFLYFERIYKKNILMLDFEENLLTFAHQPFPTLKQTFDAIPPHTGFNIEIKWPTLDQVNQFE